ncbi:electron transfer flavoprotein subunit alpha/FixB family protein [Buttiauxella gaviniae]|uniref:electron transfer flavoprotein subunit alpha/FixB family protein n=1 Tax=Buttiauxella gaviniae TaxID=82990 RepID=UPI0039B0EF04
MKIALVVTEQNPRQLAEMTTFVDLSELESEACEIWRASGITENILMALETRYREAPQDMLLFASGIQGNELATRLATRLKGEACCGVIKGEFGTPQPQFTRPVYGNALVGTFSARGKPWCVSVARSSRSDVSSVTFPQVVLPVSAQPPAWLVAVKRLEEIPHPALNQARFVVVAGQGVASLQNMERVKELARQIGAETGASRQVVMNAWCEMESLIGMSGALIAPEVCIVAGVSGASAFNVGIRDSHLVIAINNDPDATIFNTADVIVVDEMMPVLEALAECFR